MHKSLKPGDPVVVRVSKNSTDPGPRAKEVHPAKHGDWYSYEVEKFWTVSEVLADGSLNLVTRRGKTHTLQVDDPRLRPLRWWEHWFYRDRIPLLTVPPNPVEFDQTSS